MQAGVWDPTSDAWEFSPSQQGLELLAAELERHAAKDIALLVSAQYTDQDYASLFSYFIGERGIKHVYQWREPTEQLDSFDGLLLRGDRNANTRGLQAALAAHGISATVENQFDACIAARPKLVIALSPELPFTFPSLPAQLQQLASLPRVSLWTTQFSATQQVQLWQALPLRGFAEKMGTVTNFQGKARQLKQAFPAVGSEVLDIAQLVEGMRRFRSTSKVSAPRKHAEESLWV
jgi:NADH-quinone oxidoreductase subunit G